ncbi:MAG: DUF5652 family protein [Candidatus Pacearchaeota archaeon]
MVTSSWFIALVVVIVVWDLIWKGIGMWRAGRNNQLTWFIVILIFNTVGILSLIYLMWFQKKESLKTKIIKRVLRKK